MYSFKKGFGKSLTVFVIFLLPIIAGAVIKLFPYLSEVSIKDLLDNLLNMIYPNLGNLSIASVIYLFINFLKVKAKLGRVNK